MVSLAAVVDRDAAPDHQRLHSNLHHVHHAVRAALAASLVSLALSPPAAAKMYEWRPRRHHKRLGQLREDANTMILNQARPDWSGRDCCTARGRRATLCNTLFLRHC